MKKTIVFDMDGTLANFYGVKTWLADLAQKNASFQAETCIFILFTYCP